MSLTRKRKVFWEGIVSGGDSVTFGADQSSAGFPPNQIDSSQLLKDHNA